MEGVDHSTLARGRLAVLSAHLSASFDQSSAGILESSSCSAAVAPPPYLKGLLTVIDDRTGKKYQVQVSEEGTVKATDLKKITTGKNDKGIKLYDPGYLNTAPVRSSICYIDGDEGILRYRGYPIEELAEGSSFLEVAYLLMYGNLPSEGQLADWEFSVSQHSAVPQGILHSQRFTVTSSEEKEEEEEMEEGGDVATSSSRDDVPMTDETEYDPYHDGENDEDGLGKFQGTLREWVTRDEVRRFIGNKFKEFLLSREKPNCENLGLEYLRLINEMVSLNKCSLEIDYTQLIRVLPNIAIWLADAPQSILEVFEEVANKIVFYLYLNYKKIHQKIYVCITNFPVIDQIRDNREIHLNTLIRIGGVVTRHSGVFPQLQQVKYDCNKCGAILGPFVQSSYSEVKVGCCPECRSKGPFTVNVEQAIYTNYQGLTLQESPGIVPAGRIPRYKPDIIQAMPHDAHPMGVLVSAMSALSVFHPDANPALRGQDIYMSKQVRDKQIVRILGKAPTIAAAAYLRMAGRPPVLPSSNLSYSENFLYMLDSLGNRSYKPNPRLARTLDILFILHAEHEMNCSTAAARHLASSGVDVYTALAGAVGALYGPLHGGANEAVLKMLSEIGSIDNIPDFIEGVKNRKRKMSGFGHRVYKNYDPRAKVIKNLADEVFSIVGRDPLIEVAIALEKAALSDEYFVKRKLYPNVDFYSGLIYRAMGFPTEFFPVLFAIPRMAGYLSHWRESLDDPDTKIMRPAQVYTGVWLRHYMPLKERMVSKKEDKLGQVAVSNATRRRLAGSGA